MKASSFRAVAVILAGFVSLAAAQEPPPATVAPPAVAPLVPLTAPPTTELTNLWNGG